LRPLLPKCDLIARRRQLTSIDKRGAAIVGVHETGNRHRVLEKPAEIIKSDDDMLACGIDGNGDFRLSSAQPDSGSTEAGRLPSAQSLSFGLGATSAETPRFNPAI
jgi:hypothetical protein